MKKQSILKVTGVIVLLLIALAEGVLLYYMKTQTSHQVVTVGQVKLELREPEVEKQKKEETQAQSGEKAVVSSIKPGEKIVKDPTIVVAEGSQRAYIRASILIEGLEEHQKRDLLSQIDFSSGWYYNPSDGYYYYKNPLEGGEAVNFFKGVTVPEQWKQIEEEMEFQINVVAEGVQATYLTPNINASCQIVSWSSTDILEAALK